MFRHRGKRRTLQHNLKLASLLSFVAGIVNVIGFFSVQKLTTNVTGHFAFFADEVARQNFSEAWLLLLFILSFFCGAFTSSFLVEYFQEHQIKYANVVPISLETSILIAAALLPHATLVNHANEVACSLLFAMGLQNALVTSISNAVVRTTHLTGLFTDLGIELSQLFFYRKAEQLRKLRSSVFLRFVIIFFFFSGCIAGCFSFIFFGIAGLLLAAICLIIGMLYDNVRFRVMTLRRKLRE